MATHVVLQNSGCRLGLRKASGSLRQPFRTVMIYISADGTVIGVMLGSSKSRTCDAWYEGIGKDNDYYICAQDRNNKVIRAVQFRSDSDLNQPKGRTKSTIAGNIGRLKVYWTSIQAYPLVFEGTQQ